MTLKRGMHDAGRIAEVTRVMFKQGMGYFVEEMRMSHALPFASKLMRHKFRQPDSPQVRLRKILEELGGTFVKLGQLLSVRPDLVPAEYCEELKKLQDDVLPFGFSDAKRIVEHELGKDLSSVFSKFDKQPIAAASIGQVYRATLKKEKKEVAVKVQRPNVREEVESDIDLMYFFAHKLEKHSKSLRRFSPVEIVREFERYTKQELDYTYEAKNAELFATNFKTDKIIVIPSPYWDYTTKKVLVSEFIIGEKLTSLLKKKKGFDKKRIVKQGMDAVVKMIFEDGFFHADVHPGNILILPKGRIALLDFGIVGNISRKRQDQALELFIATMSRDTEAISRVLLEVGDVSPYTDVPDFKREVEEIIGGWYGSKISNVKVTHMLHRLFNSCIYHGVKMPSDLVLLGKAAVTMEGTCEELEPDFDFVERSRPYMDKILKQRLMSKNTINDLILKYRELRGIMSELPRQTASLISKLDRGKLSVNVNDAEIKKLSMELGRSSSRVTYGVMIAAFVIAGVLVPQDTGILKYMGLSMVSWLCFGVSVLLLLVLSFSIMRENRTLRQNNN